MIEVDCRKCINCTGEECIPFGKDADIAVFDKHFNVLLTMVNGKVKKNII